MSMLLQADEKGDLLLPHSLLPQAEPLGSYRVENSAGKLIIAKEQPKETQLICELPPQERVQNFRDWVASLPPGPGLSDEAVSRDSIY